MNRRDFLKLSMLASLATVLPKGLIDIHSRTAHKARRGGLCGCRVLYSSEGDLSWVTVEQEFIFVRCLCGDMYYIRLKDYYDYDNMHAQMWQQVNSPFECPVTGLLVTNADEWWDSHVEKCKQGLRNLCKEWGMEIKDEYGL